MKTKRVSLDLWKAIAIMLFAIVLVACGSSANAATDTSEAAAPADTTIDEAAEAQSSESAEAQSAEPAEAADHEDAEDADHEHSDEASSEPAVIAIAEEPVEDMIQPVATPLEKAVMGVGGAEALKNLHALSIEAGGVRHIHDEGFVPGGELRFVGPYAWQVNYDIAGDNLRVDHTYGSGENARMLSEIIAAELGALDGQATGSGAPGVSNMLSDRWASARKLQRLLNPHLILLDLMDDPSMAVEGGEVLHDGSVYHLLLVEDEVAPMALYINAGTGRIAKLTTTESHALRRDVPLEVFYYGWQPVGRDGLFFPAELYIAYDGGIVHK